MPANRCQKTHVGVGEEVHLVRVDTGQLRRLLIAADGVQVTADGRLGCDVAVDDDDHGDPKQHVREALVLRQPPHEADDDDADDHAADDVIAGLVHGVALLDLGHPALEGDEDEDGCRDHADQHAGDVEALPAEEVNDVAVEQV